MKKKLTLAIDEEIIGYVDKQIKERLFGSRSHAFEYLVKKMMEKD